VDIGASINSELDGGNNLDNWVKVSLAMMD
jgi:hypothetical protein